MIEKPIEATRFKIRHRFNRRYSITHFFIFYYLRLVVTLWPIYVRKFFGCFLFITIYRIGFVWYWKCLINWKCLTLPIWLMPNIFLISELTAKLWMAANYEWLLMNGSRCYLMRCWWNYFSFIYALFPSCILYVILTERPSGYHVQNDDAFMVICLLWMVGRMIIWNITFGLFLFLFTSFRRWSLHSLWSFFLFAYFV